MRGLVIAAGLGAVAGAAGAVAATRLMETSEMQARLETTQAQVQARLDATQTQMSDTVGEMRRLLDQTRTRLQAGWTAAADAPNGEAGETNVTATEPAAGVGGSSPGATPSPAGSVGSA